MIKKLKLIHIFFLNHAVTTFTLLLVMVVYGVHLFVSERQNISERIEPVLVREADLFNAEVKALEDDVNRLKNIVEFFDVIPKKNQRQQKFVEVATQSFADHPNHYNAFFAFVGDKAQRYFGHPAYVFTVKRNSDNTDIITKEFLDTGFEKSPDMHEMQWWWVNQNKQGVNFTDFYFDKDYTEKLMYSTTVGLYNKGKLEAVVGIDNLVTDIPRRLSDFKWGTTGGILIVDNKGLPVLPLATKNLPLIGFSYSTISNYQAFQRLPKKMNMVFSVQKEKLQDFVGADGKVYLTYSMPIKGRPWNLVMYQEKSEAYEGLYWRLFVLGFVALFAYGLLSLTIWLTGRYVLSKEQASFEELKLQRDRAETATKAKTLFLSTMSHEIRTPLNAMLGSAELMEETNLTEEQAELLTTLRSAGDTLLGMLNNVLDVSKFESGHQQLEKREFLLSDVIREVDALVTPVALRKGLIFSIHGPELDRWVVGDSLRLKQVLMNLLGNAAKFTDKGKIELTIQPYLGKNGSEYFLFEIQDTGVGIAKENLKKIFDEFGQEDSSVTRRYGGTGLGLNISQKIVRAMGAELYCESVQHQGSKFYFSVLLPSRVAHPWQVQRPIAPVEFPTLSPSKSDSQRRVLIVDDMEENHALMKAYLKRLDHVVADSAYDGFECLEKCHKIQYDLVFMDVQMPRMSGLDTIRKLRDIERIYERPAAPVVVISANSFLEDIEKSLSAGANDHCSKPIRKQTVFELVNKYCVSPSEAESANT